MLSLDWYVSLEVRLPWSFGVAWSMKPGIVEMDLSILDGLSGNATAIGDFKGNSGREAPSSARKDVSTAKW